MKKIYKVFLIIAVALMILGVIIAGAAFAASGFNWNEFAITEEDFSEFSMDIEAKDIDTLVLADLDEFTAWYDISVVPSEDDAIHVTYRTMDDEDLYCENQGNTMTIRPGFTDRESNLHRYIGFFDIGSMPMTIAVPASVKNVDLRCGAGDVDCSGLELEGDFTYTGDASRVVMDGVKIGGALHLESDTSSVTLYDTEAKTLTADVDCGYLRLENVRAEDVDVRSDFGDFEFSGLAVEKSLRIYTDEGNVNGIIDGAEGDFTIMSSADVGTTNLPASGGSGAKFLEVRTDAGAINIQFMK